jgi:hypothetical protein
MKLIACTLRTNDRAARAARWSALAARALGGVEQTEGGLRLTFTDGAEELAALAELERDCCAFATWTVDGTTLLVDGGSPEAVAAIQGMFAALAR